MRVQKEVRWLRRLSTGNYFTMDRIESPTQEGKRGLGECKVDVNQRFGSRYECESQGSQLKFPSELVTNY